MKTADIILPTSYLPPINWWVIAIHCKSIVLEQHETYPKQTYRNRCHIYSANGIQPLSIPVIKTEGNHTATSRVLIDYSKNWQMNHWRSLEAAYARTPYFLYYRDYFHPHFSVKTLTLSEFNGQLIATVIKLLRLNISITDSNDYFHTDPKEDYRLLIHPKKEASASGISIYPRYIQAFESKHNFLPNMSIIDLLFHEGPDSGQFLMNMAEKNFNEKF